MTDASAKGSGGSWWNPGNWFGSREPEADPTPEELQRFNPLELTIGAQLEISHIDLRNLWLTVDEVESHTVEAGGRKSSFCDYHVGALCKDKENPLNNNGEVALRLRVTPYQKSRPGADNQLHIFWLDREFEFDEEFVKRVKAATGEGFEYTDSDEETVTFFHVTELREPWLSKRISMADENHDGKVDADEVLEVDIEYWILERETTEDGDTYTEYLIVEVNQDTGLIQTWRGWEESMTALTIG